MTAFAGSRNGRSYGSKVAVVLQVAVGSPQTERCRTVGFRFWADVPPAKKINKVTLAINASAGMRGKLEFLDVLLFIVMVGHATLEGRRLRWLLEHERAA